MNVRIEILYEQRTFSFGQEQDSIRAQKTLSDICAYAIKNETFCYICVTIEEMLKTHLSTWEFYP